MGGRVPFAFLVDCRDESAAAHPLVNGVRLMSEASFVWVNRDVAVGGDLAERHAVVCVHRGVGISNASEIVWEDGSSP